MMRTIYSTCDSHVGTVTFVNKRGELVTAKCIVLTTHQNGAEKRELCYYQNRIFEVLTDLRSGVIKTTLIIDYFKNSEWDFVLELVEVSEI